MNVALYVGAPVQTGSWRRAVVREALRTNYASVNLTPLIMHVLGDAA